MTALDTSFRSAQILEIEGEDALAFAHAQFASDVHALTDGAWQWSAWLDARGRVIALLQVARTDRQRLVALLRGGDADAMAARLQRYVFRSRVRLRARATGLVGDAPALDAGGLRVDGDALVFGMGDHALRTQADASAGQHWRLHAVRAGHPWLEGDALERFLPPALSLRRLGAIAFDKGCFPGQEVAARLHYRGGHKLALCRVASPRAIAHGPLPAGTDGIDDAWVLDCVDTGAGFESLLVARATDAESDDEHERSLHVLQRYPA